MKHCCQGNYDISHFKKTNSYHQFEIELVLPYEIRLLEPA